MAENECPALIEPASSTIGVPSVGCAVPRSAIPPSRKLRPRSCLVDLSGFTKLTEERGDETAVRIATSLQRRADATAARYGGRSVKLLGDGAMLRFSEPAAGLDAALDLVRTMGDEGAWRASRSAHPERTTPFGADLLDSSQLDN
jgi:class 3 adenylate cyclase